MSQGSPAYKAEIGPVLWLYQSLRELAGPWENVIIKDNGSVIVIGNNSKWALGGPGEWRF